MNIAADIAAQYARWSLYVAMSGPLLVCGICAWSAIISQGREQQMNDKYFKRNKNFIRFYRVPQLSGNVSRMEVFIDSRFAGYLRSGETRDFDVRPGKHNVYVRTENTGRSKRIKLLLGVETLQKNVLVKGESHERARLMCADSGEFSLR